MADAAFDPDQYLKEKTSAAPASSSFDPDQYLKEKGVDTKPDVDQMMKKNIADMSGAAKASNEALANTLTFGHLPQIEAKASQVWNGEGWANDANYTRRRDENIAQMKANADQYPMAHAQGTAAGFAIPAIATMGASVPETAAAESLPLIEGAAEAAPAASKLATVAKGVGTGAAIGAAQNPGDTPGVVDPVQARARAENALIGGAVGGTVSAAGEVIPKVASALSDKAKDIAETQAFKASGAMLKDFRNAFSRDQVQDLGRFMLDKDIVQAGDSVENVAQKATAAKQDAGAQLDKIYKATSAGIDQATPEQKAAIDAAGFNPVRDKAAIMSSAKDALGSEVKRKSALQGLSDYLDDLAEEHGDMTLDPRTANDIKSSLDKEIRYSRNPLQPNPAAESALYAARSDIADRISNHVDAIGQAFGQDEGKVADALKAANSDYSKSKTISDIANDRTLRNSANQAFGLTDNIAGAAATAVSHNPVAYVAGAAASKGARKYGTSAIAASLDSAADTLAKVPAAASAAAANPAVQASAEKPFLINGAKPSAGAVAAKDNPPLKGQDKWAADGFQNLMQHASTDQQKAALQKMRDKLMNNPAGRRLLTSASDQNPGSKSMQSIMDQVQELGGKN